MLDLATSKVVYVSPAFEKVWGHSSAALLIGSVRGDYAIQTGRNIIHGSDCPQAAQDEISLWFTEKEVVDYEVTLDKWVNEK